MAHKEKTCAIVAAKLYRLGMQLKKAISILLFFTLFVFCNSTQILLQKGKPLKDLNNSIILQLPITDKLNEFKWKHQIKETIDGYTSDGICGYLNTQLAIQFTLLPLNSRKIREDSFQSLLRNNGLLLDTIKNISRINAFIKRMFPSSVYLFYPSSFSVQQKTIYNKSSGNTSIYYTGSLELTLIDFDKGEIVSKVTSSSNTIFSSEGVNQIQSILDYCSRSSLINLFGFSKNDFLKIRSFYSPNKVYSMNSCDTILSFVSKDGFSSKTVPFKIDTALISNDGKYGILLQREPISINIIDSKLNTIEILTVQSKPDDICLSDNSEYLLFKVIDKWNVYSIPESKLANDVIKKGYLKNGEQFYCILLEETGDKYSFISLRNGNTVSIKKEYVLELK